MTPARVFEPIRIRHLEVPNRIVRSAHGTALGLPPSLIGGEDFIRYHLARAEGGVGLSILEAAAVHPSSGGLARNWDDDVIERYREFTDAIRPHGMRVFQQLFHGGNIYPTFTGQTQWGVSTVPAPNGAVGAPMTGDQIEELVAAYAAAARRCRDGGLDGVEVHSAHGYLPAQFLSPLYNTRTDDYGGSLQNRMRFVQQVLRAIRSEVGDEFVVGIRLGASEMPGSIQEGELRQVIEALEGERLIDYLMTTWGDYYRMFTMGAGMDLPAGYELPSAGQLTSAASVPSIVTGRFRTLEEAEQVLADGVADMVSMVRALIADPAIVRKTREGRVAEIRPCIACNQGCNGGLARFMRIGCTVNPAAGFEATLSEDLITPVEHPRRVLVVGGGPAGLEAARIAAACGHEVTLVEASSALGGALSAARRAPRSALLGDTVDWLAAAVERARVKVVLGTFLSSQEILDGDADTVVVATGSQPRLDGFQPARPFDSARGVDQPHVLSSTQLLTAGVPDGARTALVLDTVGQFEAIAAAEYLVDRGLEVTFVTALPSFGGPEVHATHRDVPALLYLYGGDFTLLTRHHLAEIGASTCVVHGLEDERTREVPAAVVVLVTQNEPNRGIYDELVAAGHPDLYLVGDAAAPRDLQAAIAEGHRVARSIPSGVPATA